MSSPSLPPLERLGLARLSKQDFSQIVQCWPLSATQNAVLAFPNTTVSKDNLETKSHLAWPGSWWKISDNFRGSFPKALLCCSLGWAGGRSEAFRQLCLTDPLLTDLLLFPKSQPDHHLPCSKGWGIFLTQIPTMLVSTPAQPHSPPTRVNAVSRHFWEENHLAYSRYLP